jgi:fructose-1,6-bisphosphatase/inositol monophosphatase family enzyme
MQMKPEPAEFVKVIAPSLRRAASMAREFEGRVANRPKSGEATQIKAALTIADTEAQEMLLAALVENFPYVGLRAEEDTPTVARFHENPNASVVIDPIDGTLRFYLERSGPYGVMIGLALENEYAAGLVALPREGYQFEAVRGGGARFAHGDEASRPIDLGSEGSVVMVSHDLCAESVEVLRSQGFEVVPACGGAISVAPLIPGVCAGLRVATNDPPNVSIRGRIGAMISAEAGAQVRRETGAPFPLDIDEPARALIVAASSEHVEALRDALGAAGIG